MDFLSTYRQNAKAYGCPESEIEFLEKSFSLSDSNLVFTFKQFKAFCEYWIKYKGECPGSWSFRIHPKNNGINLENKVYMSLIAISPTIKYFKPIFGPGFIDDIVKCWDRLKDKQCNLVVMSIDGSASFHTICTDTINGFIGGGRVYYEPSACPMQTLEDMYKHHGRYCRYDPKEKILWTT